MRDFQTRVNIMVFPLALGRIFWSVFEYHAKNAEACRFRLLRKVAVYLLRTFNATVEIKLEKNLKKDKVLLLVQNTEE